MTPPAPESATQPIGSVLLEIATDVDPAIASEFEDWCKGHFADNLRLPGFLSARRLRRCGPPDAEGRSAGTLSLYELRDASALETPQYAAREIGFPTHFNGRIATRRSLYRELSVSDERGPLTLPVRPVSPDGARRQPIGPAVLHVTVDVEPAFREPFLVWYADVHVPAVLSAAGMLGARRFANVLLEGGAALPAGQHPYFTLYEMEDAGVLARPELVAAAARGACPPELAPHRVACNFAYEELFRAAAAG